MIESMIGISIAIIGLLGVLALLSRSMSLNRVISNQLIATYLASEGIEVTKNIIDTNFVKRNPWNSGFMNAGNFEVDYSSASLSSNQNRYILLDKNSGLYSYQGGDLTPFIRTISVQPINSDEIKIKSTVRWIDRGSANFEIFVEDYFFNWRT